MGSQSADSHCKSEIILSDYYNQDGQTFKRLPILLCEKSNIFELKTRPIPAPLLGILLQHYEAQSMALKTLPSS